MARTAARWIAMVAAGLALAGTAAAADEVKKRPAAPSEFYARFLMPQMASRLSGEIASAANFVDPRADQWTRDKGTVARVGKDAVRAMTNAVKNYAIESLGIDAWSLSLVKKGGTGLGNVGKSSGGTRLRFGISHLAPRGEVLIPVNAGRVAFSADALGRLATSFDSVTSDFQVGVGYDVPAHSGTFSLGYRF